ncbi:MAG: class II aldolase/adducin family protein [Chitinispirillales bacterium]|jgi:rhamnose utilization protein RhaD (predicted bifunctional aldolase and dehydrogenase)|nr:class II aldolase/adducin family protein [Chitinispirillales bacterium]
MVNRWNGADERRYLSQHSHPQNSPENDLLLQAYATVLLGAENDLTMHGGGNTSVKKNVTDGAGKERRALFVKSSGTPLSSFIPEYFVAMDLDFLEEAGQREGIDDETMSREFMCRQLWQSGRLPSIESLMHALIPAKFVDHTHPAAILKIVNRLGGRELLKRRFGDKLAVIPYARVGFDLAKAVSGAVRQNSGCKGVVMAHHGLITWGENARGAYETAIDIITEAESFLAEIFVGPIARGEEISVGLSIRNYELIAPIIKICLSQKLRMLQKSQGVDNAVNDISLTLINAPDILGLINSPDGKRIISNSPMTPDYPMHTRILPLWIDGVDTGGAPEKILSTLTALVDKHVSGYENHIKNLGIAGIPPADLLPHALIHPQAGVICLGVDTHSAQRTADFTRQAFSIRQAIAETGGAYESLPDKFLFEMRYRGYRRAH